MTAYSFNSFCMTRLKKVILMKNLPLNEIQSKQSPKQLDFWTGNVHF